MKPAVPYTLPISSIRWEDLIPGMGRANRALARYDGLLAALPNADILLAPMTTQEAVLSSRIEGTQATFGEILKADAGEQPREAERGLDIFEVINYRRALRQAVGELDKRPFSLNLLRAMHATLLNTVRGEDKARGNFRSTQNWIGPAGSSMGTAYFVPPEAGQLPGAMSEWEKYYHADAPDALVQLAVVHGQFEYLHPFLDGNGRLGRLLVPLFLFEKKQLSRPAFYLSSYLERHRDSYIARLRALGREASGWQLWCDFFLTAVAEQADANGAQVGQILELYRTFKQRAIELTHSEFAVMLVDAVFARPIFSTSQLVEMPHMPTRPVLIHLLSRLAAGGILSIVSPGRGRRSQIWACDELISVCERYGK